MYQGVIRFRTPKIRGATGVQNGDLQSIKKKKASTGKNLLWGCLLHNAVCFLFKILCLYVLGLRETSDLLPLARLGWITFEPFRLMSSASLSKGFE